MLIRQKSSLSAACVLVYFTFFVHRCVASGFALAEQSVSGLGNAFAGGAAVADDASVVWFNPAAMSAFESTQVSLGTHFIQTSSRFTAGDAARPACLTSTACRFSGNQDVYGFFVPVPNLYWVQPITPKLKFGLGINAPFGLKTAYSDEWVGRYQAVESKVEAHNINPSLAYQINDQWSVGAGLNYQQFKASFTNELNYMAVIGQSSPATAIALNNLGRPLDGLVKVKGSDSGVGYNLGVWFKPSSQMQFGAQYRSAIKYKLRGNVEFNHPDTGSSVLNAALANNPALVNGNVSLDLKVPASASVSGAYYLTPKLQWLADVSWTGWRSLQSLDIYRDNGVPLSSVQYHWKDTWRVSTGANYHLSDKWMLRAGVAYDQSPVSTQYRTARLPDQDRYWFSLGTRFKLNQNTSFDVSYARLQFKKATISQRIEGSSAQSGVLDGNYRSRIQIFSVGLNINF